MTVKVKKRYPASVDLVLLEKLVNAAWRFDPFCGMFKEEVRDSYAAALANGNYVDVINDLIEMLNASLD